MEMIIFCNVTVVLHHLHLRIWDVLRNVLFSSMHVQLMGRLYMGETDVKSVELRTHHERFKGIEQNRPSLAYLIRCKVTGT